MTDFPLQDNVAFWDALHAAHEVDGDILDELPDGPTVIQFPAKPAR